MESISSEDTITITIIITDCLKGNEGETQQQLAQHRGRWRCEQNTASECSRTKQRRRREAWKEGATNGKDEMNTRRNCFIGLTSDPVAADQRTAG